MTDLKGKVKGNVVFLTKVKIFFLKVLKKQTFYKTLYTNGIVSSNKNKDDVKELEELADVQSNVKQDRLEAKLVKQSFP